MSPGGKMKSFFSSVAERVTSSASGKDGTATVPRKDGFSTAKVADALFTPTTPAVDGEDCLHDCETCTVKLPRGWKIDEEDQLYGQIKGWARHIIVGTGKTDWVRDVADEKASVMEAIDRHNDEVEGGRLMVSASNIPVPDEHSYDSPYGKDRPATVLLMPAFQFVDNVKPAHVPELIKSVINHAPTNTSPLPGSSPLSPISSRSPPVPDANGNGIDSNGGEHTPSATNGELSPSDLPAGLSLRDCPHKYVVLMCSQATRDARCGQSAPLLRKELERHLRPLGLYRDVGDERPGGVGIYFISHTGGHKYSANVMVYRRAEAARSIKEQMGNGSAEGNGRLVSGKDVSGEAAQCIWLARVRPEHCENIVRYTILQGKVVRPETQLRGGFDREKGVVSW